MEKLTMLQKELLATQEKIIFAIEKKHAYDLQELNKKRNDLEKEIVKEKQNKKMEVKKMYFKQLQKRTAFKKWMQGEKVYIVPCKVYPDFSNPWITPCEMPNLKKFKEDHKKTIITDNREVLLIDRENKELFDLYVSNFIHYNCNYNQLGRYPHFYILEK